MSKKIQQFENTKNRIFWCPACNQVHTIDDKWTYSGTDEKPTVRASVKAMYVKVPNPLPHDENGRIMFDENKRVIGAKDMICHLFITDGKIRYLNDCTHEMAGQTVDMEDLP